jgi:adenosine deaminase|tara:strand:+ start:103 stop:339 length:237 start_codon:yes stop_codon:yes gene_type:complete
MLEEGLSVGLNTDDPSMFQTTLTREFQLGCNNWGLGPKEARQLVMGAVDGSWADESEKRSMRDEFGREFDRLDAELEI